MEHCYLADKGTYIPISPDRYLLRQGPHYSQQAPKTAKGFFDWPQPIELFTNPLAIPDGFGQTGFDIETATMPSARVSNGDYLFLTIEYDRADDPAFMDEQFSWFRGIGGDGPEPAISKIDEKFSQYRDYRGYSAVFRQEKHPFAFRILNQTPTWRIGKEAR